MTGPSQFLLLYQLVNVGLLRAFTVYSLWMVPFIPMIANGTWVLVTATCTLSAGLRAHILTRSASPAHLSAIPKFLCQNVNSPSSLQPAPPTDFSCSGKMIRIHPVAWARNLWVILNTSFPLPPTPNTSPSVLMYFQKLSNPSTSLYHTSVVQATMNLSSHQWLLLNESHFHFCPFCAILHTEVIATLKTQIKSPQQLSMDRNECKLKRVTWHSFLPGVAPAYFSNLMSWHFPLGRTYSAPITKA